MCRVCELRAVRVRLPTSSRVGMHVVRPPETTRLVKKSIVWQGEVEGKRLGGGRESRGRPGAWYLEILLLEARPHHHNPELLSSGEDVVVAFCSLLLHGQ